MFRLLSKQHTVWPRKLPSNLPFPAKNSVSRFDYRPELFRQPFNLDYSKKRHLTMGKRKNTSMLASGPAITTVPIPVPWDDSVTRPTKRRKSQRETSKPKPEALSTNPDKNANVLDGPEALRASPDADELDESMNAAEAGMDVEKQVKREDDDVPSLVAGGGSDSALSDLSDMELPAKAAPAKSNPGQAAQKKEASKPTTPAVKFKAAAPEKATTKESQFLDPEAEGEEDADEEEIQAALSRPPPVNSDYLPLPWKGRLGYVSFARQFWRCR